MICFDKKCLDDLDDVLIYIDTFTVKKVKLNSNLTPQLMIKYILHIFSTKKLSTFFLAIQEFDYVRQSSDSSHPAGDP